MRVIYVDAFLAEMASAGFPEASLRVWRTWTPIMMQGFVNALNATVARRLAFRLAVWEVAHSSEGFAGMPKMDPDERAAAGLATLFPPE